MARYKIRSIGLYFVLAVLLFIILKSFFGSLFFTRPDRLNFVFYDEKPIFYSLGFKNNINYIVPLYADLKVDIPGGYGYYRLGALGKLVDLEKKPAILKRSFSSLSSTMTDYYFYKPGIQIYYGKHRSNLILPSFYKVFIYRSSAGFFDKLYIFLRMLGKSKNNFNIVDNYPIVKESSGEVFDSKEFLKDHQGFFYRTAYREENSTVQIIYTKNYKSAVVLGNIFEGNGIRVSDISKRERKGGCRVIEHEGFSKTARDLAKFLDCELKKGNVEGYDIIVELGNIEAEWN